MTDETDIEIRGDEAIRIRRIDRQDHLLDTAGNLSDTAGSHGESDEITSWDCHLANSSSNVRNGVSSSRTTIASVFPT